MWDWLIPTIVATVGWGGGYAWLRPVQGVSPFIIQILYSSISAIASLIAMLIYYPGNNGADNRANGSSSGTIDSDNNTSSTTLGEFRHQWKLLTQERVNWCILGYIGFFTVAALAYFYAIQVKGASLAIITALTSLYPCLTLIVTFIIFQDHTKHNLYLVVPALVLLVVGGVLLVLSKKPST